MTRRTPGWAAEAVNGLLAAGDRDGEPFERATIDSRLAKEGVLFVGLPGAKADGATFAPDALRAGAWGVLIGRDHAEAAVAAAEETGGTVIVADDPLAALGLLANARLRELGCSTIGITGSTGKTSTKDILAAMLAAQLPTHASPENHNTEIGLPLTVLGAPDDTQAMVLEMAMRGEGQIAQLVDIAEPDVGVVVNVGPVHLELLGTLEKVASAKAELIRGLHPHAACVIPANEELLAVHLRDDLDNISFGEGGDVTLESFEDGRARIGFRGETVELELSYSEPYNLQNTLAAVGAAKALGITPSGRLEPRFSSLRGEVLEIEGGITVVNDCYNANPVSMRAALEHLAGSPAARRLAVLGHMAELGADEARFHREIGELASKLEIDVLITVGEHAVEYTRTFEGSAHNVATPEEAADLLEELARSGDRVLIKGSRSAGLERVLGD